MNEAQKQTISKLTSVSEDQFLEGVGGSIFLDKIVFKSGQTFALIGIGPKGDIKVMKCDGEYKENWYIMDYIEISFKAIQQLINTANFQ